ncbi:hypothetical protein D5018_00880 [Parashewanella curva]|uniref:Uncharacterized protein n=1 Tax=Parashewanella curva TaxID=2338552 RepID=A0A3L8Q2E5_9GAMM|nr:hypothetical protein [Parashewanella curva]RLV61704.1 hypothetical protein D5018_00880 [Parashewanella curva]
MASSSVSNDSTPHGRTSSAEKSSKQSTKKFRTEKKATEVTAKPPSENQMRFHSTLTSKPKEKSNFDHNYSKWDKLEVSSDESSDVESSDEEHETTQIGALNLDKRKVYTYTTNTRRIFAFAPLNSNTPEQDAKEGAQFFAQEFLDEKLKPEKNSKQ